MLSNLNLNLLRSLHVLLEECHVSRAAQRLHITQSAVSRQLSQLREVCGDPLLVRDGNHLVPTPRAVEMQDKLRNLLGEFDALLADKPFEPETWQHEFVLSSSDYVAQYILPDLISQTMVQAPKLNIAYRLWQPEFLEQFDQTGIHLASTMLAHKPEHLSCVEIGQDKSMCVMRNGHPLASHEYVTCADLVAYPHLKVTGGGDKDAHADTALAECGFQRRIALKVPFFSAAVNALKSSDYLMIVPEHIALHLARESDLIFRPLPLETREHLYWLMWHPKYDQDKAHQWMRSKVLYAMQTSPYSIGMI